jgi:hypothetical protein
MHEPPTEFQMILLQAVTHYHHFDLCCIIIHVCHAARALLLIPKKSLPYLKYVADGQRRISGGRLRVLLLV